MQHLLIISSQRYIDSFKKFRTYAPETDLRISIIPSILFRSQLTPEYAWLPSFRILPILKHFEPDAILTDQSGLASWGAKAYKFISKRRIPLIFRLRGDWWTESQRQYGYYEKILHRIGFFTWVRPLKRSSIRLSDLILPMCSWLNKKVNEKLPKKRTQVIYQGVDPKEWFFEPGFEGINKPAVGIYQDCNVPLKTRGLVWFSKVIRRMQDTNFYVAGGGKYMDLVKKKCNDLKNVYFLSRLDTKEARRFLSTVDVYILPSGLDCSPSTLLEAGLTMKPSIASRIGGIPELILDGKTGWTIPNGLEKLWERRIRTLLLDSNLAKRMGQSAQNHIIKNFSWETISKKLVYVIKQEIAAVSKV